MNLGALIPIAAILGTFIFVIFMVLIKNRTERNRDKLRAELYRKAIENGVELPKDILPDRTKPKESMLQTGLIITFVGIGICAFMYLNAPAGMEMRIGAGGLVPLFLGLGFIVAHFANKKSGGNNEK